ncbi:MAG: alpha/beta fold hydrolase [Myxococcota bacterium]
MKAFESPPRMCQVGAFRIAYREWGRGPVLLLVHGLGSSSLAWMRCVEQLCERHRVIAVDLPGFGESEKPKYHYTLSFYASRLVTFLDAMSIARCHWVGHSMGGQIAVWAALRHPERVESLVLVAPAGLERFRPEQARVLRQTVTPSWVRRQTPSQLRKALATAFHELPREADALLTRRLSFRGTELDGYAHAFARGVNAMLDDPIADCLPHVTAPSLVLFGATDRLVPNRMFSSLQPVDIARRAGAGLGAEVVLLPQTGHLVPFERPSAFSGQLTAFLGNAASHKKMLRRSMS